MIYLSLRNPEVPDPKDVPGSGDDFVFAVFHANVEVVCIECGRTHDKLWTIKRRGYDSGLWWPYVIINGARLLLDASLPTTVVKLPRDAKPVSPEDAVRLWHEDNESHVFGGPNVAKALRETIAQANSR